MHIGCINNSLLQTLENSPTNDPLPLIPFDDFAPLPSGQAGTKPREKEHFYPKMRQFYAMNRTILIGSIFLALLCVGCLEQESNESSSIGVAQEKLTAAIISPHAGDILSTGQSYKFEGQVKGGQAPYTYSWSSSINGPISSDLSFSDKGSSLSPGEHILILKVTDSTGESTQASVIIRVM
jgi:hypothetical protein